MRHAMRHARRHARRDAMRVTRTINTKSSFVDPRSFYFRILFQTLHARAIHALTSRVSFMWRIDVSDLRIQLVRSEARRHLQTVDDHLAGVQWTLYNALNKETVDPKVIAKAIRLLLKVRRLTR